MPKKVINDYVFYKIVCISDDIDLCYIGSTANWKERQRQHKSDCNNENSKVYNSKKYEIIRANGGWGNFKMIEIGKKEQLTRRQAEQVEEEYRQDLKATMNSKRCFRTEEQKKKLNKELCKKYKEANKDYFKEYNQNYYEANKDKYLERQQNYYETNKDKILEKAQKFREANRDRILEKAQKFRENNKDLINEKALEKVKCHCGCMISKANLLRHKTSSKHIKLMNQIKI